MRPIHRPNESLEELLATPRNAGQHKTYGDVDYISMYLPGPKASMATRAIAS
jgi:hypothetical protein